jgi:tetratricopeptide (TPR) repeat protein
MYDEPWFGIGSCLNKQNRWYEAIHFLNKAVKLNDEHPIYWRILAEAEYNIGNMMSCLEAFEKAALLDPECKETWLQWSFVYYEQGDYDKAIATIMEGMDELPEESELYYRAVVYLIANKQFKEAFSCLENALVLDYEKHTVLYDFFTDLGMQKALFKIIDQYRKA